MLLVVKVTQVTRDLTGTLEMWETLVCLALLEIGETQVVQGDQVPQVHREMPDLREKEEVQATLGHPEPKGLQERKADQEEEENLGEEETMGKRETQDLLDPKERRVKLDRRGQEVFRVNLAPKDLRETMVYQDQGVLQGR